MSFPLTARIAAHTILISFLSLQAGSSAARAQTAAVAGPFVDPVSVASVLKALEDEGPPAAMSLFDRTSERADSDPFLLQQSAAVAALYRGLAQLSAEEQYDGLTKWMLSEGTADVRVLTALVPETAPPMEFARAIGERPKKESFAVASVGASPGIFCSAWMLVTAADETGNLRKLITELEQRAENKSASAEFVLTLARLRDTRAVAAELSGLVEARSQADPSHAVSRMENAVILAAALLRPELAGPCEKLADWIVVHDFSQAPGPWMGFLRRLRAIAILKVRSPASDAVSILQETPPLWISATDQRLSASATGSDRSLWLTHEDHVQRLSGPGEDLLLFRYPLTGKFELKGEVSVFDHGTAGMTYGGLCFNADEKQFTVRDVMRSSAESRSWPFVAPKELRLFNRVNIRSDSDKVLFLSNLHPGASIPLSSCNSSPWLGLQASGVGRPYFRNLELVGEPVIPRSVSLLGGADLRGWTAPLGELMLKAVQPLVSSDVQTTALPAAAETVWSCTSEGLLEGQQVHGLAEGVTPRQLTWMRPLLEGETLRYEYFYEDGKNDVHPTLGRLAFLLEPSGVRIRWVTANATDWTGLKPDNAVIEPLNRKGPRSLPLKSADWNVVALQIVEGKLTLTLNDEVVYLRSVADFGNQHPGFWYDARMSSARIRQVTLSGGTAWPAQLTTEQMAHPLAMATNSDR